MILSRPKQLLLIVILLCVSCSLQRKLSRPATEKSAIEVLELRWSKKLTPRLPNFHVPAMVEEHDRFDPVESSSAAFASDKRHAFIGAVVGGLYCLNVKTGATVWRFEVDDPVGSTPLYDPQRKYVYFGADDGRLYALHARSGRKIWSQEMGSEVRRKLRLREDTLYASNANSVVFAVNPDQGEILWQYRRAPVEGFAAAGYGDITVHESVLYVGFSDGSLVAIDAINGTEIWLHDLASEVSTTTTSGAIQLIDTDASPVVIKDSVVTASVAGGIHALSTETGKLLWLRSDIKGVTGLYGDGDTIYAAQSGKGLLALDRTDGRELWSSRFPTGVLQDPVLYKDVLLVSDSEYGLYVISAGTGDLLQRVNPYQGFFAKPAEYGGYVLIIGNHGTLYAFDIN